MKTKGRRQSENVQAGGAKGASPFAIAAIVSSARRERSQEAAKSPFGPAMEKAAKANKIARTVKNEAKVKSIFEEHINPGGNPKQARPNRFDAKKAKGLAS